MENPTIGPFSPSDQREVLALVERAFFDAIAPHFGEEGIRTFLEYLEPEKFEARQKNHLLLTAKVDGALVGLVEIRNFNHISMLFVEKAFRGSGLGRKLFTAAMTLCRAKHPELRKITVNASPNSIPVYKALGFITEFEMQTVKGIRFLPMEYRFQQEKN